ncbi:diacylglycerol/lipid kinase family protein [Frondihabitans cladoniiphilus]|uniref:Diacylglycerol kinase family protein n=1 Tax=Frondihabitans cladoniiphilus TaxID=715785 RepID=A0ABP8W1N9_9MICO
MTDPQTAAVIYNPIKVDIDLLRSTVGHEAGQAGWAESLWFETSEEDVGQDATARALEKGVDLVIVAGGDGTVRAVVEAVRGHDVPVALLPSGTGNLLARNLEMSLDDVPGSIHAAFTGAERSIDVGMIRIERDDKSRDEHAFVVMAGLGLDAKMIANTDEGLKKKAGWAAYLKAMAVSLRDKGELHVRFRLNDGRPLRATVHTLILANCGSLPGNILLLPDAVLDDGLFDLLMARPGGPIGWVRTLAKVIWANQIVRRTKTGHDLAGQQKNDGDLHFETTTDLVARFSRPEEIELDGDGFGKAVAFKAWVEPGSLRVRTATAP